MTKTYCVYETYKIDEPNKNYIGKSSLERIKQINYLGSGEHLKSAIKKYGKEMFSQRILKEFNTEKAAYEYEEELEPHKNGYYNISIGGRGGQTGSHYGLGKPKPGTSAGLKINNPMFREENKAKLRGNQHGLKRHLTRDLIIPLVEKGWDRNRIARHFNCSPHTIKARILGKPIKVMWREQQCQEKK